MPPFSFFSSFESLESLESLESAEENENSDWLGCVSELDDFGKKVYRTPALISKLSLLLPLDIVLMLNILLSLLGFYVEKN